MPTRWQAAKEFSKSVSTTPARTSSREGRGESDLRIVEAISEWVATRYPAANPEPTSAETCLYTSIEDDRFVIERHGPIVVCSACSGHGFKFAPAVGARVAALA